MIWRWSTDGKYTSRSTCRALHVGSHTIPGCKRIWQTWAPLRVKLFLWLAMRRRLWTVDRRLRHGLDAPEHCFLCDQEAETIDHIIASCSYSRQVYWHILVALGADASQVGRDSMLSLWNTWRARWRGDKRKGADSLFALVAWELWKERNGRCFRQASSTVMQILTHIMHIADQWIDAGAAKLRCLLRE